MINEFLEWIDGIDGCLLVHRPERREIRTTSELASYLRLNWKRHSVESLGTLGALGLFFAIREFGIGAAGGVLRRSEKALDSFYLFVGSQEHDARIQAGVDDLRESLDPHHRDGYEELVRRSYDFVRTKMKSTL